MDTHSASIFSLQELIDTLVEERVAARRAEAQGAQRGPVTGFTELDRELGGALAPGLHIVQAAPGAGKTAFTLQVCGFCGFPAIFVSAEMSPISVFYRLIAQQVGIGLNDLQSTSLHEDGLRQHALMAAAQLCDLRIIDASIRPAPIRILQQAVHELTAKTGMAPLVVIDSIQAWAKATEASGSNNSEYDQISRGVRALVEFSSSARLPILGIAQRNRAGQERGGLFASKGTGDIEYCAETVLELGRGKDDRQDASGDVNVTVEILKNRHGSTGAEICLKFNGSRQTFRAGRQGRARLG